MVATGQGRGVISERMSEPCSPRDSPVDWAPALATPLANAPLSPIPSSLPQSLGRLPGPSSSSRSQFVSPIHDARPREKRCCSLSQHAPIPCPRALRARSPFCGRTDSHHRTSPLNTPSTLTSRYPTAGWRMDRRTVATPLANAPVVSVVACGPMPLPRRSPMPRSSLSLIAVRRRATPLANAACLLCR
jgi:hypothetical protein